MGSTASAGLSLQEGWGWGVIWDIFPICCLYPTQLVLRPGATSAKKSHIFQRASPGEAQNNKAAQKAQERQKASSRGCLGRAGKRSHPPAALASTHPCKGHRLCKHLRGKEELADEVTHCNTRTGNAERAEPSRGERPGGPSAPCCRGWARCPSSSWLPGHCPGSALPRELPRLGPGRRAASMEGLFLPSIHPPLSTATTARLCPQPSHPPGHGRHVVSSHH